MNLETIMVVDDSESDQLLAELMIEDVDPDIKILKAYDGQEALEGLRQLPKPELILLDINMPRMNGFEFLERYKNCQNQVPVVVLSSSNQEIDIEQTTSYDCVKRYVVKPLEADVVEELLRLAT